MLWVKWLRYIVYDINFIAGFKVGISPLIFYERELI